MRNMTPADPAEGAGTMKHLNNIYEDLDSLRAAVEENRLEVNAEPVPRSKTLPRSPSSDTNNNNNNMADVPEGTDHTADETSLQDNEEPRERETEDTRSLGPPPRPPAPSADAIRRRSFHRSNTLPAVKLPAVSVRKPPPPRPPPPERPPPPPLYCDKIRLRFRPDSGRSPPGSLTGRSPPGSLTGRSPPGSLTGQNHQSAAANGGSAHFWGTYCGDAPDVPAAAPRLRRRPLARSASGPEASPSQTGPPSPSSDQTSEPIYSEIETPQYIDVLPEDSEEMHITGLLRWFKRASRSDCTAPSVYGLSIEEEIRSFSRRAVNVAKALRLFNHLMMKRKENLQNILSEFRSICDTLDKIHKKNKTMTIAGGTTGAVGGVTAVMGLVLAPATLGASLVATVVGAGMVASAGGMSAHAAKANKKIATRTRVERLAYDYKADVEDLQLCLTFILDNMAELRRHDVARLHRAGAPPDAVKMAHRSEAVCRFRDKCSRGAAATPTSVKLLQAFLREADRYFSETNGNRLRKSMKSAFSARVSLLAENLQDELDYLNDMWEIFSS